MIEGHQVQKIHVDSGSSSEIMYEHCFKKNSANIRSGLRKCIASLIGFLGETYHPLGVIGLRIIMGEAGRNKTILMEFAIVRELTQWKQVKKPCGNADSWRKRRIHGNTHNGVNTWNKCLKYESKQYCEQRTIPVINPSKSRCFSNKKEAKRMVDKVLADQKGHNVEIYLEEIVMKRKDEQSLIKDVEETLNKLKWVDMNIDPNESTFRMKEGRFLGYTVTEDGIRTDGEQIPQAEGTTAVYVERKKGRGTQTKQRTPSMTNPNAKGMEVTLEQRSGKRMFGRGTSFLRWKRFWIMHLPKKLNPKAEVLTGLATIKLEFLNKEVLVGIKTRPSVEVGSNGKEGKATSKVPMRKPNYNWETSESN
uniref:Reverse transcriptase domain-containing protein n=1 Tax=Tanacetum cinerariifolium TaxID=118510 RepID=A0A6L2N7P3_TANCI|nr:reverse transcriptase domain-containing protein [Tanacetum cinerariifolium]